MGFSKLGLILRGMTMGIAEVIPGVSGGTIAFITGIYKTLLDSIKSVNPGLLRSLFSFDFGAVWQKLNGPFLLWLMVGMVGGVLIGVFGVSYLLEAYPQVLWALFFGLILASVPFMFSTLKDRKPLHFLLLIVGTAIAFGITCLTPVSGSLGYGYVFVAGAIAISALVLPGISGSFMLLLMGLYTTIIPMIRDFLSSPELSEFLVLAIFGLGCLTGLMVFSRIVSAAFEKYHDGTIALLSGFMLGSLNKIWPWRNPSAFLDKDTGRVVTVDSSNIQNIDVHSDLIKIISESNVLPSAYHGASMLIPAVLAFLAGLAMVYLLTKVDTSSK